MKSIRRKTGKFENRAPGRRTKRRGNLKSVLTLGLMIVLLCSISIGGTLAFLQNNSNEVVNTFEAAEIQYTLNLEPNAKNANEKYDDSKVDIPKKQYTKTTTTLVSEFDPSKDPSLTGYTFEGWYYDEDCVEEYTGIAADGKITVKYGDPKDSNDDPNKVTITLYAKWEPITYIVKYDKNGPNNWTTGETEDSVHTYDLEQNLTENGYTRTGYTFLGWSEDEDATSATFTDQQPVINLADAQGAVIQLYAVWKANDVNYKVEHWLQNVDGADEQNETNYTLNETETFSAKADSSVTPDTKTYEGFTAPSKKTVTVSPDGSTVVKYYYTRNSYKVTLNKGTGIDSVTGAGTYRYGATVKIDATVNEIYKWTKWTGDQASNNKSHSFTMPARDVTNTANAVINIVNYKVQHWQQKLGAPAAQNSMNYTLVDTETFSGTVGTSVTPAVKTYTGFTSPSTQTVTIKADGTTVVNYYYTRNSYKVTLNKETGISSVSGAGTYQYGASVTIDASVSTGYSWSKWTGTHNNQTTKRYTFTMPANDVKDTANATANTNTPYKVEHYQQNLTGSGYTLKETENKTGTTGASVTPPVKSYTGFKSPNPQTVTIKGDGSTVVKYYYDRLTYTVTVKKGTGISSVSGGGTYRYGASVTIDASVSTGYSWSKWTGTHNTTTQKYTFTVTGNVTDTANATINKYTVNVNAGTGVSSVSGGGTYNYNASVTINASLKTGYKWVNWTGSSTVNNQKYTFNMPAGNRSWTANATPITYTVKYNGNGATGGSTASTTHTYDTASNLRANGFTRTGYTFAGWATSSGGGVAYGNQASVKNLSSTDGATVNLYAKWTPNTYKVYYHSNDIPGSSGVGDNRTITDTVTYGSSYTFRNSNIFSFGNNLLGTWSNTRRYNITPTDIPVPGSRVASYATRNCGQNVTVDWTGDIHLYAVWTPKTVEVWGYSQTGGYPYGLLDQNYAPNEIAQPQASPAGYLWQEHPSSSLDGLRGNNNIRKDDLHAYPVGYNSVYRYQYAGVSFDITYMKYFRFDIRMASGTFEQLKAMTSGQIEFTSSGTCDNQEISALWSTIWANSYYINHYNTDTGDWMSIYVPLSIFSGNTNKAAINFVGFYWAGGTDIGLRAFMCDPRFEYDLPAGAVHFDLPKPNENNIDFSFNISIDELGAFANEDPMPGKDYIMEFDPAEGYTMPESILVRINDEETIYTLDDLYAGTDENDKDLYMLWIPGDMLKTGDKLYIEALVPEAEPDTEPTAPTEPATQPTEPATQPTEPATQPTEPATQPTEPATQPTEPVTEPTDPAAQPALTSLDSTEAATEPTVAATESTVVTDPTEATEEEA